MGVGGVVGDCEGRDPGGSKTAKTTTEEDVIALPLCNLRKFNTWKRREDLGGEGTLQTEPPGK